MGCRYSRLRRLQLYLDNCRRKVQHDTPDAAHAALEQVRSAGMLKEPEKVEVYLCSICGKYHWGRKGIIAKMVERGDFLPPPPQS